MKIIDIAKVFDLVPYPSPRGGTGYTLRITAHEHAQARSHWHATHHYIQRFGARQAIARQCADNWIKVCNHIVDLHIMRRPLTRIGP